MELVSLFLDADADVGDVDIVVLEGVVAVVAVAVDDWARADDLGGTHMFQVDSGIV